MEFPFPREVTVRELPGIVRFEFPRRRLEAGAWLPPVLIALGIGLVAGGVAWIGGVWTSSIDGPIDIAGAVLLSMIGLALVGWGFKLTRFAVAILWGRAVIELGSGTARSRDRLGPFEWGKSRSIDSIRALRITVEKGHGIEAEPAIEKQGSFILATGYPFRWLVPIAHALAARVKENPPEVKVIQPDREPPPPPAEPAVRPPQSRAQVERADGVLRIRLPRPGFSRDGRTMFIIGAVWTIVCAAIVVALLFVVSRGLAGRGPFRMVPWVFLIQFGLLGMVGPLLAVTALRQALRRGTVEVTDALVIGRDRWPLEEVVALRCGRGTAAINGRWMPDLDIHLRDGRVEDRFEDRDAGELRWLADVLQKEIERRRPRDVKVVDEVRATGGVCQVCGAEMTSAIVWCASCGTPHHEECWKYAGRCSTFGCSEQRVQPSPPE